MSSSSSLNVNSISPAHASSSSTPSIPKVPSELTSRITSFLDPETAKTLALMPRLAPMIPSLIERAIISGHDVTNDEGITAHIDDINGTLSDDVRTLLNVDQTPLEKCSVGRRATIFKNIEKLCKEEFSNWLRPQLSKFSKPIIPTPKDILETAGKHGSVTIVQALLTSNESISDSIASTLHEAATNGHFEIVRLLLQSGTVIPQETLAFSLANAVNNGDFKIVQLLLQNGAVISEGERGHAVVNAAKNGDFKIVQLLLRNGAVISQNDRSLALIHATENRRDFKIVQLLLQNGDGISAKTRGNALCNAAQNGQLEIVQLLLANDALEQRLLFPPHIKYAITLAAKNGHINLTTYLTSHLIPLVSENSSL